MPTLRLTALNKPEAFILAIVAFQDDGGHEVRYVRGTFGREPDFGAVSVNYRLGELWVQGSGRGEGFGCLSVRFFTPFPIFVYAWEAGFVEAARPVEAPLQQRRPRPTRTLAIMVAH